MAALPSAVTAALPDLARGGPVKWPGPFLVGEAPTGDGIRIHQKDYGITVDCEGATLQEVYSYIKEQFKTDNKLMRYPFPMTAITPEYMEMSNGWQVDPRSHNNIKKGALRLNEDETLMCMVALGPEKGAFGGAIDKQDFFGRVGNDVQPLGKYPFNQGIVVTNDAPLSELEIIDGQDRVWANAANFGIQDGYRCGPIYYPIFEPKGYHLDLLANGTQDFVDEITFWMNKNMTKAEAYAMVWPNEYEQPPHNFGFRYDGPPIKKVLT